MAACFFGCKDTAVFVCPVCERSTCRACKSCALCSWRDAAVACRLCAPSFVCACKTRVCPMHTQFLPVWVPVPGKRPKCVFRESKRVCWTCAFK